jgi:poly(hydroxyalkanoate) depolymerase family esterase
MEADMTRYRNSELLVAGFFLGLGLLAAVPARAASLTMVPRSTWGATGVPSYMQMYIYVPNKVATKPAIYVSCHSCGSTATGQISNIPMAQAAADSYGFILLLPDNPGQNCWDVGTTMSLTHDGGGDTQGLAEMVKYTIKQYNADPTRVYIMGGSGGAMMTQAMLAVYPDLFAAGAARAGVAAGCWSDGYQTSNQWSNNCAAGNTTKTAQQWGDLVRGMYPGYNGRRPRLQMYQGDADTTISYKNMGEAIKEWTNVLNLPTNPTSTQMGYQGAQAKWNIQRWANSCGYNVLEAWTAPGATHSMNYEEAEMLKFFGLDSAANVAGADPEPACNGGAGGASGSGSGGAGGASGGAGHAGSGGAGGAAVGSGGAAGHAASGGANGSGGASSSGGNTGSGGASSSGGSTGSGGASGGSPGSGGNNGSGGAKGGNSGSGGMIGSGGNTGSGGNPGSGGNNSSGSGGDGSGGSGSGGSSGSGSGGTGPNDTGTTGCTCAVDSGAPGAAALATALLFAALGLLTRRRPARARARARRSR